MDTLPARTLVLADLEVPIRAADPVVADGLGQPSDRVGRGAGVVEFVAVSLGLFLGASEAQQNAGQDLRLSPMPREPAAWFEFRRSLLGAEQPVLGRLELCLSEDLRVQEILKVLERLSGLRV